VSVTCELAIAGAWVRPSDDNTDTRNEDAALIALCIEGDEGAFRRLVDKYRPMVQRTIYALLRDREAVRDLSQEAFVRVYGGLERFDRSRSFGTWLRRIAVNLAIDEMRRRRRRGETPLNDQLLSEDRADPVSEAEAAEDRRAVREILDQLPIKYRTVLVLRELEGLSSEEVARIIGRPQVSVRWRLHRARQMFRERWVARFGEVEA